MLSTSRHKLGTTQIMPYTSTHVQPRSNCRAGDAPHTEWFYVQSFRNIAQISTAADAQRDSGANDGIAQHRTLYSSTVFLACTAPHYARGVSGTWYMRILILDNNYRNLGSNKGAVLLHRSSGALLQYSAVLSCTTRHHATH